jgi:hypothetical protein
MAATLLIESKVQSMHTWGSKKIIYANLGFYFGFRFHAMKARLSYCIAMGSFTRGREYLDSDCSNYLSTSSSRRNLDNLSREVIEQSNCTRFLSFQFIVELYHHLL